MKKITKLLVQMAPTAAAFLVAVAALEGVTAATWVFNQPKAPQGLDKFRRFK
ncbi:MAG: hypothetical protein FWD06_00225 [Oscillospiraceae bacterium]|nr:hypothetical protein [Oscillospiraceae bacterium]